MADFILFDENGFMSDASVRCDHFKMELLACDSYSIVLSVGEKKVELKLATNADGEIHVKVVSGEI